MRKIVLPFLLLFVNVIVLAQTALPKSWRAHLVRKDSNEVVFNITTETENGKQIFYIINDIERIKITDIHFSGDSIFFEMPAFESTFRVKKNADGSLHGTYIKATATDTQYWPFYALPNQPQRFPCNEVKAMHNISGRWDVTFTRLNGTLRKAVAEFKQVNSKLTGTFITPSGDYRYLDGMVDNDSLILTTFDGSHAYLFTAKINNDNTITSGNFFAGYASKETWIATKNNAIDKPVQELPATLKPGETKLNFTFTDISGKPVSINDERYKNKVVIVQIMGSWCPNCLDETKFLSEYYNTHINNGVEVIGLAYEYTTNTQRSVKSLQKFQKMYDVQYPLLITGATASDDNKTEKTLPQLTPIRSFPTTVFIDKKGNVRYIKTDFYGPGTGNYYEDFKKEFYKTVNELLQE